MNSTTNIINLQKAPLVGSSLDAGMINDFIQFLDVKPRTLETYRKALKQFFLFLSQRGITKPERNDIIQYRNEINSIHKATTTQSYLNAVKRFFAFTELMGLYPDITRNVKNVHIDRTTYKKDYLTQQQLKEILLLLDQDATPEGLRNKALFLLAVTGALRTVEIERANVEDLKRQGGNTVLYVQGKGKDEKDSPVILQKKTFKAIQDYLLTRTDLKPNEPLFTSTSNRNLNGRMSTRAISGILKDCMKKAGYNSEMLTAHSLRHTAATLNLRAGADITEVQQFLRHTDISNTLIYAHMMEAEKNQCSARIEALF